MSDTISADEYNAIAAKRKPSKYRNVKVEVDGHVFDSRAEARRYGELKLLEAAGAIADLRLHPRFPIIVNGVTITRYSADFSYLDADGSLVVEDVKGGSATKTRAYVIRRKLVKALYDIDIVEVTA